MLNRVQENDPHRGQFFDSRSLLVDVCLVNQIHEDISQCTDEIIPMESEQQSTIMSQMHMNNNNIEEMPAGSSS